MQLDSLSFLLAVAIFVSGILSPIIANFLSLRQTNATQREELLKEKREYLLGLVNSLIKLRAKLQFLQEAPFTDENKWVEFREQQESYGEAFGIMLSVNDSEIRSKAVIVKESKDTHEKLEAINFAIIKLGKIIDGLYSN